MKKIGWMWMGGALVLAGGVALYATSQSQPVDAATKAAKGPHFAVVGKPAPDFALPSSKGSKHKLSQYKGKLVVLEWLNHGCPFVKKHYRSGNMQKLQKKYTAKGVVWLSIVSSAPGRQGHCTPKQAKQLTQQKKATPTAVLLDPKGKVGRTYKARTTPHMYIINKKGVLSYAGAIDNIRSTNPADTAKAKNYVSAALNELMAGKKVTTPKTRPYGCSVKY